VALTKILESEFDWRAADVEAKRVQQALFKEYVYEGNGGASGCAKLMRGIYGSSFNETDARNTAKWLEAPCPLP
jgi:hypothetical protein